jgi:hypothetical protein
MVWYPIDMTAELSSLLIGMNVLLLIAGAVIAVSAWVSHRASFLSHGAFLLEVRAEADARLAVLNAVDPETLPAERREEYQYAHRAWSELRRMTEDEVTALHEAACLEAGGRELTPDELRGLLVAKSISSSMAA